MDKASGYLAGWRLFWPNWTLPWGSRCCRRLGRQHSLHYTDYMQHIQPLCNAAFIISILKRMKLRLRTVMRLARGCRAVSGRAGRNVAFLTL